MERQGEKNQAACGQEKRAARPEDVTALLAALCSGDTCARNELFSVVYRELHDLARASMRRERGGHLLQATALVNELFMIVAQKDGLRWENRTHFFNAASKIIQHILVNESRRRKTLKRGGRRDRVQLDTGNEPAEWSDNGEEHLEQLALLDEALKRLDDVESHERVCRVLDLHLFSGLTLQETAQELDVSRGTIKNDWAFAKAWLFREMNRIKHDGRKERREDQKNLRCGKEL